MKKRKKKGWIIAIASVLVVGTGGFFGIRQLMANRGGAVSVVAVSELNGASWVSDDSSGTSDGTIVSDVSQNVTVPEDKTITEVYVEEGDEVKIGDKLLSYDTTLLELDIESQQLSIQDIDLQIKAAQKELTKLQNTTPVEKSTDEESAEEETKSALDRLNESMTEAESESDDDEARLVTSERTALLSQEGGEETAAETAAETQAPETEAPTEAPATEAPTEALTEAPATEAPVTETPATEATETSEASTDAYVTPEEIDSEQETETESETSSETEKALKDQSLKKFLTNVRLMTNADTPALLADTVNETADTKVTAQLDGSSIRLVPHFKETSEDHFKENNTYTMRILGVKLTEEKRGDLYGTADGVNYPVIGKYTLSMDTKSSREDAAKLTISFTNGLTEQHAVNAELYDAYAQITLTNAELVGDSLIFRTGEEADDQTIALQKPESETETNASSETTEETQETTSASEETESETVSEPETENGSDTEETTENTSEESTSEQTSEDGVQKEIRLTGVTLLQNGETLGEISTSSEQTDPITMQKENGDLTAVFHFDGTDVLLGAGLLIDGAAADTNAAVKLTDTYTDETASGYEAAWVEDDSADARLDISLTGEPKTSVNAMDVAVSLDADAVEDVLNVYTSTAGEESTSSDTLSISFSGAASTADAEDEKELTYTDEKITVTALVPEDAELPENAELKADYMEPGTKEYEAAIDAVSKEAGITEDSDVSFGPMYDIYFLADGERVEPAAEVEVQVSFAAAEDFASDEETSVNATIYHVTEQGKAEDLGDDVSFSADGSVNRMGFSSDLFSPIVPLLYSVDPEDQENSLTVNVEWYYDEITSMSPESLKIPVYASASDASSLLTTWELSSENTVITTKERAVIESSTESAAAESTETETESESETSSEDGSVNTAVTRELTEETADETWTYSTTWNTSLYGDPTSAKDAAVQFYDPKENENGEINYEKYDSYHNIALKDGDYQSFAGRYLMQTPVWTKEESKNEDGETVTSYVCTIKMVYKPMQTAFSELDWKNGDDGDYYKGSGTKDDPYVFLVTDGVKIKAGFMNWVLGFTKNDYKKRIEVDESDPDAQQYIDEDGNVTYYRRGYYVELQIWNNGSFVKSIGIDGTIARPEGYPENVYWIFSSNADAADGIFVKKIVENGGNTNGGGDDPGWYDPDDGGDGGDDGVDGGDGETTYTAEELAQAIKEKQREIRKLELDRKEAELKLKGYEKDLEESTVVSAVNGYVKSIGGNSNSNDPYMVVASDGGLYLKTTISELSLDSIQKGDTVSAQSWMTGASFTASITQITYYPSDSDDSSYYGSGNQNASQYPVLAYIEDTDGLEVDDDVTVSFPTAAEKCDIYLPPAYVRSENGQSYVYVRSDNGTLKKQYIKTGGTLYDYVGVKEGLSEDDYIAFPYGKNVKDGAKTQEATTDDIYY